jgi:uncharacterized protein YraI
MSSPPESDGENGELRTPRAKRETDSKISPLLIAVWTAAAAAIGNGMVSAFNGWQTHKLETEKSQSAVILEVVKTNSPDKAANNLAILVDIGVIAEEHVVGQRLRTYLKTRTAGQGPSIPSNKDGVPNDAANDSACAATGEYVVVNVHWGDDDGGLNIRTGPNQTQLGVIPTTGTGVDVGTCRGGWCQVRYKCVYGWAFAQHLALRSTRLVRVKGTPDPPGLIVRRDPGAEGEPTGALAPGTSDVVKHVCQTTAKTGDEQWCQISTGKISGWVPLANLEDQPKQAPQAVSSAVPEQAKTAGAATPASTAPPPPQ